MNAPRIVSPVPCAMVSPTSSASPTNCPPRHRYRRHLRQRMFELGTKSEIRSMRGCGVSADNRSPAPDLWLRKRASSGLRWASSKRSAFAPRSSPEMFECGPSATQGRPDRSSSATRWVADSFSGTTPARPRPGSDPTALVSSLSPSTGCAARLAHLSKPLVVAPSAERKAITLGSPLLGPLRCS